MQSTFGAVWSLALILDWFHLLAKFMKEPVEFASLVKQCQHSKSWLGRKPRNSSLTHI